MYTYSFLVKVMGTGRRHIDARIIPSKLTFRLYFLFVILFNEADGTDGRFIGFAQTRTTATIVISDQRTAGNVTDSKSNPVGYHI
jgi:hypothetical protein